MRTKCLIESIEKAKIRNLTSKDAPEFSGVYQLASGKPGKKATCAGVELVLVGGYNDTSIQIILSHDNLMYSEFFDSEDAALKVFNNIAKELTDTTSVARMSVKYGLQTC